MYSARNIPNRICKAASKKKKKDLKNRLRIVHVLSNMQNVAISSCCFVTFCKQRQRNKQRIITYAHTALCTRSRCRYSLKTNKRPNNTQPNEQKTNESLAEQKDDWECREHLCCETKSKHMQWRPRHFVSYDFEKVASALQASREKSSEKLGTLSKNNLRGITLVRGPIWGIHSLNLIITC